MTEYEKRLVQEALKRYDIREKKISFIRHNENITCKVISEDCAYALRIHLPMEGFSLKLYETVPVADLMQGEMELLLCLSERASFPVQTPVQNKCGEYISVLSDDIRCELLRWVEGKPLDKDHANPYAGSLGTLAAELHKAAKGFDGVRLSYSHDLVQRMGAEFDLACEMAHISREQRTVCQAVLDEVDHIMAILDTVPDSGSLIHADLSFGNVLQTAYGLSPIDFSLSGYGYKAQECGMLAANYIHVREQESIRESYERNAGIAIDRHHMQSFLVFSVLLFIAAQHNRFWKEKWFRDSMVRWTGGLFQEVV